LFVALSPGFGEQARPAKVLVAGLPSEMGLAAAWLEIDPLTDPQVIPARSQDSPFTEDQLRKFVRLYFPRTYDKLLEYEYMVLAQVEIWIFTNEQQKMLYDSIYQGGLGGMQTRSVMSMHLGISGPWAISILSDAFPNDADAVVALPSYTPHSESMRVVINTNEMVPPIYRPYKDLPGVEYSFVGAYGTNIAIPKDGAVIVSYSVGPYKYGFPGAYPDPRFESPGWLPQSMYWTFGKGTTWTHQDMFGQYWNTIYNPYAPDMVLAELIFSTGRKLPDDVLALHALRVKFTDYSSLRGFVYAIMDFAEKFGANTASVTQRMSSVAKGVDDAEQFYLDQAFQESSTSMDQALADLDRLRDESLKLKDRALMWVYVVEWLAVSGVSLVVGFAVWTLMIRRKLYKEVAVTRLTL